MGLAMETPRGDNMARRLPVVTKSLVKSIDDIKLIG